MDACVERPVGDVEAVQRVDQCLVLEGAGASHLLEPMAHGVAHLRLADAERQHAGGGTGGLMAA